MVDLRDYTITVADAIQIADRYVSEESNVAENIIGDLLKLFEKPKKQKMNYEETVKQAKRLGVPRTVYMAKYYKSV